MPPTWSKSDLASYEARQKRSSVRSMETSVAERPAPLGRAEKKWSKAEIDVVRQYYQTHTTFESFSLSELAKSIGRTRYAVAIKAGRLGFSYKNFRRENENPTQEDLRQKRIESFNALPASEKKLILSKRAKDRIVKFGHPRGMLGKHHSQKLKDAVSAFHIGKKVATEVKIKILKTNLERYGVSVAANANGRKSSWKAQWAEIGGQIFFARSSWEVNYARFLEWRKIQGEILSWEHEPETFWFDKVKRGCVSYKPDFKVTLQNGIEYHEVKGWMDSRSRTVLKRMKIYHPNVVVVLIDAPRYKAIMRTVGSILPPSSKPEVKPE